MSWKSNDDGSHYQRKSPKGKRKSSGSGSTSSNGGKKIGGGIRYKQVTIYKFDDAPEELQKKILEKHRGINVDNDWWADFDGLIYDKKSNISDYDVFSNYNKKYYDLDRGQYIQFPDLQIKDEKKLLKMLGLQESILEKIADTSFDNEGKNNTKIKFMDLTYEKIDPEGTYEDYIKYIDDDDKEKALTKKEFEDLQNASEKWDDLMHEAWVHLKDSYEYQYSDEAVKETIEANDYDFDEYGDIA